MRPRTPPGPPSPVCPDGTSCSPTGLPYSTSAQQIYDFFAGYDVKRIDFVLEPDGRPSGLVRLWG